MPAKKAKVPAPRLPIPDEHHLTPEQRALIEAIRSGPRGRGTQIQGPFAVYLHATAYGQLTQELGAFVRFNTSVPHRLSEFAILCTARLWRANFEWHAHGPIAEKAGVKAQTIKDIKAGRVPKSAAKDERAIYDFVQELYRTRRVSDRTYARVQKLLGDAATIELVGILGYYATVSMILNVFRMPLPAGATTPFVEPVAR